jgi:hypothetical protein
MNLPSGVRAAETMTTESETAAMAKAPALIGKGHLNYVHHMMRRKKCNGGG